MKPDATLEEIQATVTCELVGSIPYIERCDFIKANEDCISHKNLFSYLEFLYCFIRPENDLIHGSSLIIIIILMAFLFLILSIVADEILCPSIQMLVNVMGIGEHIAGVTLVAFGNSAPDFFSSLVTLGDESRAVYSDLLASSIFVICMVSGLIIVINPFRLYPFCILRDTLFVLCGVMLIDYFIENSGSVNIIEACLLLCMYILYILVVALDQVILKHTLKKRKELGVKAGGDDDEFTRLEDMQGEAFIELHPRSSSFLGSGMGAGHSRQSRATRATRASRATHLLNIEDTRKSLYDRGSKNNGLCKQFGNSINPFDIEEWYNSGCFGKFLIIIRLPFKLIFNILIPKTDYEMYGHGWTKLLNTIQVSLMPFVLVYLILEVNLYGVHIAFYTLPVTVPCAILVFFTSKTSVPPKYHVIFAIYAAVGAVAMIYILASEICEILFVLGTVMHCSTSFLAATVLAWGNGIGDMVSNIALSQQGYQRMGYAACYGAPIFNVFCSMGFYYCYKTITSPTGTVEVYRGLFGHTCFYFLVINSILTLLWAPFTNFTARRMIGCLLLFQYFFFLFFCLLTEVNLIHSYSKPTFLKML